MDIKDRVKFKMYDNLFKDTIIGEGILLNRVYGKLWNIHPQPSPRLSGRNVIIHEKFIVLT